MKKRLRGLVAVGLVAVFLTGCKASSRKKEEAREDYAFCEHIVSVEIGNGEISEQAVLDAEGFYAVKDNIYVSTESLNVRQGPNTESKLVSMVEYGTCLMRTGIGKDGWDRVEYDGETCYVSHEFVTTVPILSNKTFSFSNAALNVVETKHQQYMYDDLCNDLTELRNTYGSKMKLNSIGLSADNRSIFEIVIGTNNAKRDIYFVAGICGAEYMTSLVAMKQVEYYLHYYDAGYYDGYSFADLFDNVRLHIIPMLNPDSVEISQHLRAGIRKSELNDKLKEWHDRDQTSGGVNLNMDNYLQLFMANAEGTDIRKNFPYQWDLAASNAEPGSKGYRGNEAGDSAEVKALLHSISTSKPALLIAYHTTGSKIYYQYGQSEEILSKAKSYGTLLGKMMTYELSEKKMGEEGYGSVSGYCNNVAAIPSLTVHLGNGSAPLHLNEFSAIWNACRDSWAALQIKLIEW